MQFNEMYQKYFCRNMILLLMILQLQTTLSSKSYSDENQLDTMVDSNQVKWQKTKGYCRGGEKWPSGSLWDCSIESLSIDECARSCIEKPGCTAYDLPAGASSGECCLFRKGNSGNGSSHRICTVMIEKKKQNEEREEKQEIEKLSTRDAIQEQKILNKFYMKQIKKQNHVFVAEIKIDEEIEMSKKYEFLNDCTHCLDYAHTVCLDIRKGSIIILLASTANKYLDIILKDKLEKLVLENRGSFKKHLIDTKETIDYSHEILQEYERSGIKVSPWNGRNEYNVEKKNEYDLSSMQILAISLGSFCGLVIVIIFVMFIRKKNKMKTISEENNHRIIDKSTQELCESVSYLNSTIRVLNRIDDVPAINQVRAECSDVVNDLKLKVQELKSIFREQNDKVFWNDTDKEFIIKTREQKQDFVIKTSTDSRTKETLTFTPSVSASEITLIPSNDNSRTYLYDSTDVSIEPGHILLFNKDVQMKDLVNAATELEKMIATYQIKQQEDPNDAMSLGLNKYTYNADLNKTEYWPTQATSAEWSDSVTRTPTIDTEEFMNAFNNNMRTLLKKDE